MRRRRLGAGIVGVVAVAVVIVAGLTISQRLGSPPAAQQGTGNGAAAPATQLVPVTRTTLVASQPVSGTVTSTEAWTIALPTGATPDEVAAAGDTVAAANDQLAMARTDLTAATRARTLVKARGDAAVGASPLARPAARPSEPDRSIGSTRLARSRRPGRHSPTRGVPFPPPRATWPPGASEATPG